MSLRGASGETKKGAGKDTLKADHKEAGYLGEIFDGEGRFTF
jgi:hypothetical protein